MIMPDNMFLISRISVESSDSDPTYRIHTRLSDTNPFYRLSNELWVEIARHLRRKDVLKLMRVSPTILDILSHIIYRSLSCQGANGRRCIAMLASGEGNSPFYASLVQEFHVFAYDLADRYLSFQVLAKALRKMDQLRELQLHIASFNVDFLLYCLRREGHVESPVVSQSPALQGMTRLVINGSRVLLPIGLHRKLETLELTDFLDHCGLASVADGLERGVAGVCIRTLRLRIHEKVQPGPILDMVHRGCPNVRILCLEQPRMRAKDMLTELIERPGHFSSLKAIGLNPSAGEEPDFGNSAALGCYSQLGPLLRKVGESRQDLRVISFGYIFFCKSLVSGIFVEEREYEDGQWWTQHLNQTDYPRMAPKCSFASWV